MHAKPEIGMDQISHNLTATARPPWDSAVFEGKAVLVTGSGRGIGREIALTFARGGADVVVNFFRNRAPAEETAAAVEALGRRALVIRANVGDPEHLERLFIETDSAFAGLDILVCNAASGYNRPVVEQKVKGWDWTMNISTRSALFAALHALPLMQKRGGGSIVNISSIGSFRTLPDYVVVGASKAALEAVTRYLAVELAPHNIIVNAVSGGVVATEALKHFEITRDGTLLKDIAAHTPAGRNVAPADIANVVAFLCTPAAAMIRGQVIVVDGGFTLTTVQSQ
jgi:enoyl-[acyl-carrier protein] reductase III